MEKQRRLKVIILSTLIIGILTLTIAFSALSRTLNIGGVGKMDTATWDVHFENLSDASFTRDAVEINRPNISKMYPLCYSLRKLLTKFIYDNFSYFKPACYNKSYSFLI